MGRIANFNLVEANSSGKEFYESDFNLNTGGNISFGTDKYRNPGNSGAGSGGGTPEQDESRQDSGTGKPVYVANQVTGSAHSAPATSAETWKPGSRNPEASRNGDSGKTGLRVVIVLLALFVLWLILKRKKR